jgi:serine/threonine protein kinase
MSQQHFVRCQHCGLPHSADTVVCPVHRVPLAGRGPSMAPPPLPRSPSTNPPSVAPPPLPTVGATSSVRPPPLPTVGASSSARPNRLRQPTFTGPPQSPPRSDPAAAASAAGRSEELAERAAVRIPLSAVALPFGDRDDAGSLPRPSADAPLVGQVIDRRYRVFGVIARGGMGVVYDAIHVGLARPVAIKTLHARYANDKVALARFQNEAAVVGRFGHRNIVEVHDMGQLEDGSPYLAMERLEGDTVTQRLQQERPMRVEAAIDIALAVLNALMVTHNAGILHRDLKPDNIFIARNEEGPVVKVLDFGISKFVTQEMSKSALTRNGFVMGTPAYMAPEQATGDASLDARADLYAVGMILYEMLTGWLPYKANTPAALLGEIMRVTPLTPRMHRPEVHTDLDALVMRALHKDREQRFPDAVSMQRALQAVRGPAIAMAEAAEARYHQTPSMRPPVPPGGESHDTDSQQVELFDRGALVARAFPSAPKVPSVK